jgi:hypothetical protein
MGEREPNSDQQPSFEQADASLREAIKPVLIGYRKRLDILVKRRNRWTGKTKVSLSSLPSTSPEVADRVVEKLKGELGVYELRKKSETREIKSLDQFYYEGPPTAFRTKKANIVITRREVYEKSGENELAGVIWSVENLQPMDLGKQIRHKGQEIARRALQEVHLWQYFQG